jgi:hypothetical protein
MPELRFQQVTNWKGAAHLGRGSLARRSQGIGAALDQSLSLFRQHPVALGQIGVGLLKSILRRSLSAVIKFDGLQQIFGDSAHPGVPAAASVTPAHTKVESEF